MKKICVSMRNRVFAESIMFMLERTGDFRPVRISDAPPEKVFIECMAAKPDVLLLDITPTSHETDVEGRLKLTGTLRKKMPDCKIVFFCDEVAHPEQARLTMRAKQSGEIDGFLYASVTAEYLTAALESL